MMRRPLISSLLAACVSLAGLTAIASPALAQQAPPAPAARAKAPRIAFDAVFARHVLSPRGEIAGLVLQDGTLVRVARSASANTGPAGGLRPGTVVHVEGRSVRTPSGLVIQRALIKQNGALIADGTQERGGHEKGRHHRGHRNKGAKLAPITATGRVQALLAGPKGGLRAILLDDGTTANVAGAEGLGLKVGDKVSVAGKGGTYPQGKALRVRTITLPSGETRTLPKGAHHHGRGGKRPRPGPPV
jgi:hypothetical protein